MLALLTTLPWSTQTAQTAAMNYHIFLGFVAVVSAGVIHDAPQLESKSDVLVGHTGHHHQIEHDHAKSHQSIKFEHFHPVPVYVKKEFSHLLHHPLEKGKNEQSLKLIHPETEHKYGGGLVLEDHRLDTDHLAATFHNGGLEGIEGIGGGFSGGLEVGGYEGGEGLKAWAGDAESSIGGFYEAGYNGRAELDNRFKVEGYEN